MKQLMVISHDTYASGITIASEYIDHINDLAVGAIAFVDRDPESATYNKVVDLAAASEAATPALFQVATMTANGIKWSQIITKANCTVSYQAYVAPQAKIMNIAKTYTSLEAGQVAGFIVTDTTKGAHELTRNRTYEVTVTNSDTSATIIAALIAKVNADSSRCVNATAGTNIVLTRITAGKDFQVSPTGITRGATITISTAHITGTGTAAQILNYEKESQVEQGKHNQPVDGALQFTAASEVSSSGTYNTYMFRFNTPSHRPIMESVNPNQELLIAVLASLTGHTTDNTNEALFNLEVDFNG
jgi:hypothetical protein